MKKLVLLLMLFGALRSFGAVATNVQNLSAFGTTNRMIAGDGIGISVRYATAQERLLGIRASNLVYSLNLLGIGTNTVILAAGTNVIISTNRTGSNVTYTISVTNTFGSSVSPPLSSVQYNSNSVQSGSSLFVFTNSMVGIGTNAPAYPLHLFVGSPSLTALEISYTNGAGNTVAFQVRNGTGATNFQVEVGGLVRSATIHNSGSITGAAATVTVLAVTGGTLGAGKVLTDTGGTGTATWETPSSGVPAGYNTNQWTTNVVGAPVEGANNISITNLASTTNWLFYGHQAQTVARLGDVTNVVTSATLVGDNLGNHIATNRLFLSTNGQVIGSLPALSFANDPSVGLQWESADVISFNALPSTTFRISGGGAFVSSTVKFQAPQTGFGDPGYTFTTDIDTGLRNRAAGVIDVMSDNAIVFSVNQAAMEMFAPFTNNVVFRGGLQPWRFETNNNFEVFTNRTFFAWTGVAIAGTITLPNANTCSNFICIIKDQGGNATATNITISGVGLLYTNLIDGATTIPLDANFEAIRIYSSGRTNWYTF